MLKNVALAYLFKQSAVRTGELPVGTPVRVYRNLHNGKLSVQTKKEGKWKVHSHVDDLSLEDVNFKVSQSGRERVLKEKAKNVHAFVTGKVAEHGEMPEAKQVIYNPYKMSEFSVKDTLDPILNSPKARIQSSGHIHAVL